MATSEAAKLGAARDHPLPDFANKWQRYSRPFHKIQANCKFFSCCFCVFFFWGGRGIPTAPKSHENQFLGSWGGLHNP